MKDSKERDLKNLFLSLLVRNGIDETLFPSNWIYEANNSKLERIVGLAEKMTLNGKENLPRENFDAIIEKPLYSIFEAIKKEKKNEHFSYSYKVPTKPLKLDLDTNSLEESKSLFPIKEEAETDSQLKENLRKDINHISSQTEKATIETYLSILAKHTSNVSSNTVFKDVSFYDHFKTTLAISTCLYDIELENLEDCTEPVLLIGGDISGIQNFIYDIASKKASQNLKGRSFYLQLIVDSILNQLLEKLRLLTSNVIYSSGGAFYILAPNTRATQQKIDEFEQDISEKLFEVSQAKLTLILGYVPIRRNALLGKDNENNAWNNLHKNKLEPKKKQKFALLIEKDEKGFNNFFEPSEIGGEMIRDAITNEEFTKEEVENEKIYSLDEEGFESPIKKVTKQQIDLGKKLKNTDFIVVANQQISFFEKKNGSEFEILGKYYYLLSKKDFKDRVSKFKNYKENNLRIISLNNLSFLENQIEGEGHFYAFEFYGGNDYPTVSLKNNRQETKTFSEMAGMAEEEREYQEEFVGVNFKRYAVLRMDIDDLGSIFQKGFSYDKRTFTRLSALSRNLDYFFKGFINIIWSQGNYKKNTQIIYSGGDDLFIVGRWNEVLEMAIEIRSCFKEWVCNNNHLGISAGISIVTPKFPIAKAAEQAGEAEKLAKAHELQLQGWRKNSIALMGIPLHWEYEYPFVMDITAHINYIYKDVRSTLTKLQGFYEQYKDEDEESSSDLSWRWKLAYQLARTAERNRNNKTLKDFLHDVKAGIFTTKDSSNNLGKAKHTYFKLLNLAIRLAELEHRTKPHK